MVNKLRSMALGGLLMGAAFAGAQDIRVTVDGDPVDFGIARPITQNGRVLVPMRQIFEKLGAYVQWNGGSRSIDAQKGTTQIRLVIGDNNATVNGTLRTLEVPAQIANGATMVPLRFVSEALGANVQWSSANRLVAISSDGTMDGGMDDAEASNVVAAYTVLPVKLNTELSSMTARKGDRFSAVLDTMDNPAYAGIPEGAYVQGYVREVKAQKGKEPGILDLEFDRLVMPGGRTYPIDGSLYSLDNSMVERNEDGVLVAKARGKDNRVAYAGYGAGAGLLVGLLSDGKINLTNTLLGALAGFAIGSLEKPKQEPSNVTLKRGTEVGVRLNQDLALRG